MPEKSLDKKKEALEALLHTLPVGVSILGKDRVPIYTNTTLKKILKLTREELWNGKYRDRKYLRTDGSEMPLEEYPSTRVFEEKKAIRNVEVGIITELGEEIWTSVSAIPLEHDDWHVVLTITNITRQKGFEQALKQKTADLTERVKELDCLYGITALIEQPGITLDDIFQGTVDLIPLSWHYPAATSARITYKEKKYLSANFCASEHKQIEPFRTQGKTTGSVEVFLDDTASQEKPAFPKHLIYAIAERLGRITDRFETEERLHELATTDPLTGIYNRRHYFEVARHEVARAQRYHHPLTCLMIDIDYFKKINDSYGHLFGDEVLQIIVKHCQSKIRQVDIFARYGGDEFVILLPDTDLEQGMEIARRICYAQNQKPLHIRGKALDVSLSLGIASMNGNATLTLDTLLNHADQALYKAKKNGRGQLAIWDENV